jgi:serine/threonine protein phosphatase PrpC
LKYNLGIQISDNDLIAGILETTRGLGNHGDKDIKKCVINTPYFWTYNIDPTIECIILATEGLWQVLRYDVVVDIVTQVIHYFLVNKIIILLFID